MRRPTQRKQDECIEVTVAECVARCLCDAQIELVTTIPGGPAMALHRAIHQQPRLKWVLARHEAGAALMAEGHARVTSKPGAVVLTAGPGVTNAVTGIAAALVEQVPMVVISAQVARSWQGRSAAQELDTVRLLSSVTKQSLALTETSRVQATLEHLIRVAKSGRLGPVHLSVAGDLWTQKTTYTLRERPLALESGAPPTEHLYRLLCRAAAPCVLVGRGASLAKAETELLALAKAHPKLRFACSPRAKGTFPEDHPQSLKVFGFAGHANAERALLDESDLVLVLGSRLGEITSLGWDERWHGRAVVQVDLEPSELGRNFPIELGLVGDIRATLADLLRRGSGPLAPPETNAVEQAEHAAARERAAATHAAPNESSSASPKPWHLNPAHIMTALSDALSGDEHLFIDIGNCMAWATHYVTPRRPRRWHINLMFGCMGHALPAAIGAMLSEQRERAVVVVGDAAFAMTGQELHVAVERNLPLVVVHLNDAAHGMVEMGSEWQFGPGAVPSTRFEHRLDAAATARAMGALGLVVRTMAELHEGLALAMRATKPMVLDCHIDPSVIPPFGARMDLLKKNFADGREGRR